MLPVRRTENWLPSIFNDFFGDTWLEKSQLTSPSINVIENKNEFKVEVAAPGMTKEDFKVSLNQDDNLVIAIEKKNENEEKKNNRYLRREFSYSKFQQTMSLPDNIERDKINAQVENGVLTICIPKLSIEQTPKEQRIIEIQ